jgi:hypothetical protein
VKQRHFFLTPGLFSVLLIAFLLTGCGGGGSSSGPSPAAPTIASFVATPTSVTAGSSASLTAVFANGAGIITPGNLAVTSGVAVSVTPSVTTTYTLTVTNAAGTAVTQTVVVTVTGSVVAPSITSFVANPSTITAGASSNLTGIFTNGTGVITPGNLAATSGVAVSVTPSATTTYTLTVTNTAGTAATQKVTVTVQAAQTGLIANGTYTITGKNSGLVAEVANSSTARGALIDQWAANGGGNQIWQLINLGNNEVELLNVNSNLALEVQGASTSDGAAIDQSAYNSAANQIWQVVSAGGGYYELINQNSGQALDVAGASTSNGTDLDQWPTSGNANQLWSFTATSYTPPTITSVTVTPNPASAAIGNQLQLNAVVNGTGSVANSVIWTLASASGSSLSPGTISSSGLYTTPYPAPASVTVTATSSQDPTKSGTTTITLTSPPAGSGPALSVDAGNPTHAINPYVYGMNLYLDPTTAAAANLSLDRSGGDAATRYNYQTDSYNSASDWWFENEEGSGPYPVSYQENSTFNTQLEQNNAIGTKMIGTVPLIGWTTNRSGACSYSVSKYGAQQKTDTYKTDCGNGILLNGQRVVNDPTDTSTAIDETFTSGWVKYLVGRFGPGANGGVAIWDLDNEPSWWSGVHVDVHPIPFTYDEVTQKGLTYAKAIKDADPTAEVSGPVMDNWWMYYYSAKDVNAGYGTGPCYSPYSNPIDRNAHGGVPFIEYYLQQFAAYEQANGVRLLDYVDIHAYYAGHYNGTSVAFTTAGDTAMQKVRLDSTRALWDPTYTDTYYSYPNYPTDTNYVTNCNPPLKPLQLITMLKQWVANDYPGTKIAIDEYNWGGQESINGAVAQADVLGIFGREGLDIGALWGTPDPPTDTPGLVAFQIYRNYDGDNSTFGDMALASTSADQGALSVYGALRTADNELTIVVINKTYGDLTTTLSLPNFTASGPAKVYLYSNANLAGIVSKPALAVTAPAAGSTTSSIANYTFPAQSITLFVAPKQ